MCFSVSVRPGWLASRMAVCSFVVMALVLAAQMSVSAAEGGDSKANPVDGKLPPYDFGYTNPLYATIAGYLSVKEPELKDRTTIKFKIPNFRKKMAVKAMIQPHDAPLVVVLLGVDGKAEGPLGKLWPSWFAEAGCHVMTFDSTFLPSFVEISGRGATGNLVAESEGVKDIIAAFLDDSEIKGKVQKIGIVGMSYGGIEALLLGQMAAAGKLPFKVEAIQAYSPPCNLEKTGELLDQWYAEDRWQYTLVQLADKLEGHKPLPPDQPVPFSDSLMRAGIAAVFRLTLVDVVLRNDAVYKLRKLPSGDVFNDQYVKQDYAALWGYSQFMNDMVFPYWEGKDNIRTFSDLIHPIELRNLLENQPPYVQAIVSEDDPFNTPEDSAELKTFVGKRPLLLLPRGGHLGYVGTAWVKAKLLSLFKTDGQQASAVPSSK